MLAQARVQAVRRRRRLGCRVGAQEMGHVARVVGRGVDADRELRRPVAAELLHERYDLPPAQHHHLIERGERFESGRA
jgi:hypothetical protein